MRGMLRSSGGSFRQGGRIASTGASWPRRVLCSSLHVQRSLHGALPSWSSAAAILADHNLQQCCQHNFNGHVGQGFVRRGRRTSMAAGRGVHTSGPCTGYSSGHPAAATAVGTGSDQRRCAGITAAAATTRSLSAASGGVGSSGSVKVWRQRFGGSAACQARLRRWVLIAEALNNSAQGAAWRTAAVVATAVGATATAAGIAAAAEVAALEAAAGVGGTAGEVTASATEQSGSGGSGSSSMGYGRLPSSDGKLKTDLSVVVTTAAELPQTLASSPSASPPPATSTLTTASLAGPAPTPERLSIAVRTRPSPSSPSMPETSLSSLASLPSLPSSPSLQEFPAAGENPIGLVTSSSSAQDRSGGLSRLGRFSHRLILAYDGTDYCGWQLQPSSPTVQRTLEAALCTVLREERAVLGVRAAGRTDSGVHARGQVVQFSCNQDFDVAKMPYKINSVLPHDIRVLHVTQTAPDFSVTCSALGKCYHYSLTNAEVHDPLRHRYAMHVRRPLDLAAMRAAATVLQGTHDFTQFSNIGEEGGRPRRRNPVKTLRRVEVVELRDAVLGGVRIEVEGTGFLYKMVRHISGALVAVGEGRLGVDAVVRMLELGSNAPPGCHGTYRGYNVALAKGLCLHEVFYDSRVDDPSALLYPDLLHDDYGRLLEGIPDARSDEE